MPAMFRVAAAALMLAGGAACATARVNQADEEARIRELSQQWSRAAQSRDLSAVVSFFAGDATFMPPNEATAIGPDSIRARWEGLFSLPDLTISWAPVSIRVARSGDMATEMGRYRLGFRLPTGPTDDEGSYVTTWRKGDDGWKVLYDIVTSSRALPTMTPINVTLVEGEDMHTLAAAGLRWIDAPAPGFPGGRRMAVLHGDPNKPGDFIIRVRLPDGYEMPVHWQSGAEHLTVLSGTFMLGIGNRFDRSALKPHGPGDFIFVPAKTAHFGVARGETIIQVQGQGPVETKLGAP